MTSRVTVPLASAAPLEGVVSLLGILAVGTWVGWRFGPTLLRIAGFCSLSLAWACGSQRGCGYCAGFVVLGVLQWGGGTIWYAGRHGRWPSAFSGRVVTRPLGRRSPPGVAENPAFTVIPRRPR
jgi:hypothetical protein